MMLNRKHFSNGCVIFVLIASLVACGDRYTDIEHVQLAKDFSDSGDIDSALIELKNALTKNPENAEARFLLGLFYLEVGNWEGAEKELVRAKSMGVGSEGIIASLSRALLMQKKYERVLLLNKQELKLSPRDAAHFHANRGEARLRLSKRKEALFEFNSALRYQQDSPQALVGKARLAVMDNDIDKARSLISQALASDDKFIDGWILLGALEYSLGKHAEAEQVYSKVLDYSPEYVPALLRRASARIEQEDFEGAKNDINKSRPFAKGSPTLHFTEGVWWLKQESFNEAKEHFGQVTHLVPDHVPANFFLGVTNYALGNVQQAQSNIGKVLGAFPDHISARILLGATYIRIGDYDLAEKTLLPVLEVAPDNLDVNRLLGFLYSRKGDIGNALRYMEAVVKVDPKQLDVQLNLGLGQIVTGDLDKGLATLKTSVELGIDLRKSEEVFVLGLIITGDLDQALNVTESSIARSPESPLPYTMQGVVYRRQGENEKAKLRFEKALQLESGYPEAALNMASMAENDGDYEGAESFYKTILKANADHIQCKLELSKLYTKKGSFLEAKAMLESAVSSDPLALAPRLYLSNYYLSQGSLDLALLQLSPLLGSKPGNPALLTQIAIIRLAQGQLQVARDLVNKALKRKQDFSKARHLSARLYLRQKNIELAEEELVQVLRAEPYNIDAGVSLARIRQVRGDPEGANFIHKKLADKFADHPEIVGLKAWLAMLQGRFDDAVKNYDQLPEEIVNSRVILDRAQAKFLSSDRAEVITELRARLEINRTDVGLMNRLAEYLMLLGRYDQAKEEFANVLKVDADHINALNNLAWLLRAKDSRAALKYAERAYRQAPESPLVMDTLGMILLELGNGDRALKLLSRAADLNSDNLNIQYHLALLHAKKGDAEKAKRILHGIFAEGKLFADLPAAVKFMESLGQNK